jgi:hypothetical protein
VVFCYFIVCNHKEGAPLEDGNWRRFGNTKNVAIFTYRRRKNGKRVNNKFTTFDDLSERLRKA